MGLRTERRVNAEPDGTDERYEELWERYESLRTDAEQVVRENKALRNQRQSNLRSTAGVFLILTAFVVAGRLAIYLFVENGGTGPEVIADLSDLLFGAGSALLLFAWVKAEWAETAWLAVPKYVFVFVMTLFCANVVNGGALLRGDWDAPPTHPVLAGLLAVAALTLAASPLAVVAVNSALRAVNGLGGHGRGA